MSSARSVARRPPKAPSNNLVPIEVIEPLQTQVERLLCAFQQCDQGARNEILIVAERLVGTT